MYVYLSENDDHIPPNVNKISLNKIIIYFFIHFQNVSQNLVIPWFVQMM